MPDNSVSGKQRLHLAQGIFGNQKIGLKGKLNKNDQRNTKQAFTWKMERSYN